MSGAEVVRPDAFRVAKRAVVLASCGCRASLERSPKDKDAKRMHADMQNWIHEIGVRDEFEEREWQDLSAPLGSLPLRTSINLGWRIEGLVVLAWALGRADLPPFDQLADGPSTGDAIGFLDDSVYEILLSPKLRPLADLEWIADLTLAVHWRLRQFSRDKQAVDFRSFANTVQWATFPIDDLVLIENDLALRGKSVSKMSSTEFEECISLVRERQQAANWLMGQEECYSEVTCDT